MNTFKSLARNQTAVITFLIITVFQLSSLSTFAQSANSSPYSRYGIGDMTGKGFSKSFAMGGTSIALQNDTTPLLFINSGNPASYASLGASESNLGNSKNKIGLTVVELGVSFNRLQLENSSTTQTVTNASVGFFSLAFPIKKWWGATLGIMPYSSVGYDVFESQNITNIGDVDFAYKGNGGINQVYFGNGFKPLYGLPNQFIKSDKYKRLKEEKNDSLILPYIKKKRCLERIISRSKCLPVIW